MKIPRLTALSNIVNAPVRLGGWKFFLFAFACYAAIGFVCFSPGLATRYYADDYFNILDQAKGAGYYLTHPHEVDGFYRPIRSVFFLGVQALWGWNTIPIHATHVILHACLALGVAAFARMFVKGTWAPFLAGVFFTVSQIGVMALVNNDTTDQILATGLGFLSLYCFARSARSEKSELGWIGGGVAAFALSLFAKESALSFLPVIAIWYYACRRGKRGAIPGTLARLSPVVPIIAGYFIIRNMILAAPIVFGTGVYMFSIGLNVPVNAAQMTGAAFLPWSTTDVFASLHSNDRLALAIPLGLLALQAAIVVFGFAVSSRKRLYLLVAFSMLATCFPYAMLNHVSELYSYNILPFAALLWGMSAADVFAYARKRAPVVAAAAVVFLGLTTAHAAADISKASMMHAVGERANSYFQQLSAIVREIHRDETICLINRDEHAFRYSTFSLPEFRPLDSGGEFALPRLLGRPDLTIKIMDEADVKAGNEKNVFWLDGDLIRKMD